MSRKKIKNRRNIDLGGESGFSLVELLVAAIIVLVAVAAVIAALRMSTSIQISDYHRRQARAVMMTHLENDFARFSKPDTAGAATYTIRLLDSANVTRTVALGASGSAVATTLPDIVLDARGGGNPILGTLSFTVVGDTVTVSMPANPGGGPEPQTVTYHDITAKMVWGIEDESVEADSLILTKRLVGGIDP